MIPVTPMRQIPGAYLNTPAPGGPNTVRRRLNFNDTTGTASSGTVGVGSTAMPMATVQPAAPRVADVAPITGQSLQRPREEALPPVTKAAKCVNETLQIEESFPDIDSYCRPGANSDYVLHEPDAPWAPFHKVQMYPIPDQVFERLNQGEVQTELGLFAEINYAWAAIDSSLFLWDYTHPNPELIGYEEANQTITAVALVPPKPGVFVNTITHILVLATTSDIILLGLSATPTPSGSKTVALYQTKMSVHRGSSDVSIIAGSQSGRIFFGGFTDTDVYELFYQQEERWFSSRCGKINHTHPGWSSVVPSLPGPINLFSSKSQEHLKKIVVDDSRNLLYTLSSKSTIRTYYMEANGKLTKVIEKELTSCLRDITHMIDRSPLLNDRIEIVSLSAISAQEASKLHLMALTNTGCRLLLSATSSASYMMSSSTNAAPQSMQVQFVKFPPKDGPGERVTPPYPDDVRTDVNSRALDKSTFGHRFPPGYFFDAVRGHHSTTEDWIFVSAPDAGKIKATGPASALRYYEQGNWIDLGAGSQALAIGLTSPPFSAAKQPLGFGNELAVQFDQAPGEFAILTNTGVHIIRRRRLVDIFATAIRATVGDEGFESEVRRFIAQYGRVETVAAALAVACGQGSDVRRVVDQTVEDRARAAFVEFGGQPRLAETDGKQLDAQSVVLSSRHDALALYLTRLIRTLWKKNVISTGRDSANGLAIVSTIPITKLAAIQENVERLRNFLETNKSIIQGLAGPSDRVTSRQEEIALQKEHQALHGLRKLMESISEGISFVLMLFDERVTDIYMRLDDISRQQLAQLTYEGLFSQTPGKELAKVLVKAIVNRNIASGANVETVADALRRRCGSFCSPDDVVIFKAQEQLQRATEQANNPNLLRTLLGESLRLFEQVAGSLTSANLSGAVEQYIALKYYAGAIQLCLVVAREKDRGNTALSWVNEGKPANDPRSTAFEARKGCYSLIHEVLDRLEVDSGSEPELIDGRPTLSATKRMEAYSVVNNSDDEVFHFDLYDWYIQKGWTDRILIIDSPHVITYLQRLAATDAQHADLLCRFYTHRSRFFEAAQVQADLAKSEFALGIKDRITLLSRARANASVTTTGVSRQQQQLLNHEVTELLEVANIQDDLLERLKADPRIGEEKQADIQQALDGPIQNLSELFNNYADQAGYFDLCLLIFHAADYQNPRVITETWESLIQSMHYEIEQKEEAWLAAQQSGQRQQVEQPPKPYESIAQAVQNIAHRTSLDSLIFPVDTLLPMVCAYAINNGQDATIGADPCWPVQLFLQLGVPHALIVRVLETVFDAQEAPFTGRKRKSVIQWINVAVEAWVREVERRGGVPGGVGGIGSGSIGPGSSILGVGGEGAITSWVSDLLGRADEAIVQISNSGRNQSQQEAEEWLDVRRKTKELKRSVESLSNVEREGSLLFR